QPGGPADMGGGTGTVSMAGPGPAFPEPAWPSTDSSRPASGVPPWEITDSFLAVPPAPAEAARAVPEPQTPGPPSGLRGAGTAGAGDSTESFPAVDPGAEQRSFPRAYLSDGNQSFPTARPRPAPPAFRL